MKSLGDKIHELSLSSAYILTAEDLWQIPRIGWVRTTDAETIAEWGAD